jgi:hypothetical protein
VFPLNWKSDGQLLGIFTYENKWAVTLSLRKVDAIFLLRQAVNHIHTPQQTTGGVLQWELQPFICMRKEHAYSQDVVFSI